MPSVTKPTEHRRHQLPRAPGWCRARRRPTTEAGRRLVRRCARGLAPRPVCYLPICGSLASCGARAPCTRSSPSASARNSFSKRKCCSRDSGDRHIPARRCCSAAIARYSVALTIVSSHASSIRPAGAKARAWDAQTGPITQVLEWKARTLCVGVSVKFSLHLRQDKVERVSASSPGQPGSLTSIANVRCPRNQVNFTSDRGRTKMRGG